MKIPKFSVPPALKHRRFVLFWLSMMISTAGSQMQLWALFWHLRTLSDQPIVVSGIGLARFLPILILSLVGGLVADMYNRRKVMFISQIVMTLVSATFGLLTLFNVIQIWHMYLLTAIQAAALAFDMPARQALVPNLVPREDLPSAFSLNSMSFNIGSVVGPGLSGVVIASLGQSWTYFIDAVSFGAVILSLVIIGNVLQEINPVVRRQGINLEAIKEGVSFIRSQPIILSSMILDFFATFFSSANTLLPFIARDVLKVGALEYGWLSAAQPVGAVGVGLVFSQRAKIRKQGSLLLWSVVVFGVATIIFGLSGSLWITMLALAVIGGSDAVSTILRNTIRQMVTPDEMRGRMVSINQIFFMGGPQLGEIEAGLVAQALGTPMAIITGGLGCILAVVWIGRQWPALPHYSGEDARPV
ncbi:MAG: MFS transporter [Leptolinea sp.]|jgi:MFS family permease|nr:MFS transporter [Leptolinea sp.]